MSLEVKIVCITKSRGPRETMLFGTETPKYRLLLGSGRYVNFPTSDFSDFDSKETAERFAIEQGFSVVDSFSTENKAAERTVVIEKSQAGDYYRLRSTVFGSTSKDSLFPYLGWDGRGGFTGRSDTAVARFITRSEAVEFAKAQNCQIQMPVPQEAVFVRHPIAKIVDRSSGIEDIEGVFIEFEDGGRVKFASTEDALDWLTKNDYVQIGKGSS